MRRRSALCVALALCAALVTPLVMSCRQPPAPTVPVAPTPTPTATPWRVPPTPEPPPTVALMPALTPTAGAPDPSALVRYLPADAQMVGAVRAELDGDAQPEVMVLLGLDGTSAGLDYDHLELMVLELDRAPDAIAWRSSPLVGQRGEALQVSDINDDGRDEVLSYQSMGAAPPEARGAVATGYTLYVVGYRDGALGLLRPKAGRFAGQGHFGDAGVRVEDIDRDGVYEILASYGPAGSSTDVYRWDGTDYAFAITMQDK